MAELWLLRLTTTIPPKAICKSFPPSTLVLCSGSVHCHRSRSKPLNSRFCICYSIQLGWCMKLVGTAWTVKCFVIIPHLFCICYSIGVMYEASGYCLDSQVFRHLSWVRVYYSIEWIYWVETIIVFCARTAKIESLLKIRLCSLPVEPLHTLSVLIFNLFNLAVWKPSSFLSSNHSYTF